MGSVSKFKAIRYCLLGAWVFFMAGFVTVGFKYARFSIELPAIKPESVSKESVFTDSWIFARIAVPRFTEKIQGVLAQTRLQSELLFVGPDSPNASMVFEVISTQAWPRPVKRITADIKGTLPLEKNFDPEAVFLYGVSPEQIGIKGEQFGPLAFVRFGKR
jgi:hypothetical protein